MADYTVDVDGANTLLDPLSMRSFCTNLSSSWSSPLRGVSLWHRRTMYSDANTTTARLSLSILVRLGLVPTLLQPSEKGYHSSSINRKRMENV